MSTTAVVLFIALDLLAFYVVFMLGLGLGWRRGLRDDDSHADVVNREGFARFVGQRRIDTTGISGTGTVVQGVRFSDGWVVTHWLNQAPMYEPKTEVWHNEGTAPFEKISGHGGNTVVRWLDGP